MSENPDPAHESDQDQDWFMHFYVRVGPPLIVLGALIGYLAAGAPEPAIGIPAVLCIAVAFALFRIRMNRNISERAASDPRSD